MATNYLDIGIRIAPDIGALQSTAVGGGFVPAWARHANQYLGTRMVGMKKNVAGQKIGVQMASATDGSAFTGTVTVYITGDAGTQAIGSVGSGVCTHEGNGYHTYAPSQGETNYDLIAFTFIGTGAIPATIQVETSFPQTGDNFALIGSAGAGLTALASAANLATVAGYIDTEIATLQSDVTAVKAKTDNLPSDPADQSLLIAAISAVETKVDTVDNTVDAILADTADMQPKLGTPVTSLSADIAAIEAQTDDIGTAGAGLTALPWNSAWDAEVQSEVADALAAYDGPTKAELDAAQASIEGTVGDVQTVVDAIQVVTDAIPDNGALTALLADVAAILVDTGTTLDGKIDALNDLSSGDVVTAVGTALGTYDGPTYTEVLNLFRVALRKDSATATDLAGVLTAINADLASGGGTFANTTDALEALRDRGDAAWGGGSAPTAAQIADAVWEEDLGDHSGTAGSTAEALAAAGGAGDPWITPLPGSYTGTQAGKILSDILADTAEIANLNDLSAAEVNAEVDTALTDYDGPTRTEATADKAEILTAVGDLPTNAELAAALAGADDAVLAAIAALNDLSAATVAGLLVSYDGTTQADLNSAVATLQGAITALNDLSSAEVQSASAAALAAYDGPTNAEMIARTLAAANYATAAAVAALDGKVTTVDNVADAIKAKTDQLAFTISGSVDANVQRINDVAITGDGQLGTEFGV